MTFVDLSTSKKISCRARYIQNKTCWPQYLQTIRCWARYLQKDSLLSSEPSKYFCWAQYLQTYFLLGSAPWKRSALSYFCFVILELCVWGVVVWNLQFMDWCCCRLWVAILLVWDLRFVINSRIQANGKWGSHRNTSTTWQLAHDHDAPTVVVIIIGHNSPSPNKYGGMGKTNVYTHI